MSGEPNLSRLLKLLHLAYENPSEEEGAVALEAAARAARGTEVEAILDAARAAPDPNPKVAEAIRKLEGEDAPEDDWSWLDDLLRTVPWESPWDEPRAPDSVWSSRGWERRRGSRGAYQPNNLEVWVHRASGVEVRPAFSSPAWQWVKGATHSTLYGQPEEAMQAAEEWWRLLTRGPAFDLYTAPAR